MFWAGLFLGILIGVGLTKLSGKLEIHIGSKKEAAPSG